MTMFDRGQSIAFEAIADTIGISSTEACEVYRQLFDLGLIDREKAQEVFTEIGSSD